MAYVKIKDRNMVRDTHSKAVLNTDKNGLNEYYTKREIARKKQREELETKQRLVQLENDMTEIKGLLKQIAEARKG